MATTEERLSRLEAGYEHLATKADMAATKADIAATKADIAALNGKIDTLRSEFSTMKWIMGFGLAAVTAVTGILQLLPVVQ